MLCGSSVTPIPEPEQNCTALSYSTRTITTFVFSMSKFCRHHWHFCSAATPPIWTHSFSPISCITAQILGTSFKGTTFTESPLGDIVPNPLTGTGSCACTPPPPLSLAANIFTGIIGGGGGGGWRVEGLCMCVHVHVCAGKLEKLWRIASYVMWIRLYIIVIICNVPCISLWISHSYQRGIQHIRTAFIIIITYPNRIWHIRTAFIIITTYPNRIWHIITAFIIIITYPNRIWHIRTAFIIITTYPNRIWHIITAFIIIITYPNRIWHIITAFIIIITYPNRIQRIRTAFSIINPNKIQRIRTAFSIINPNRTQRIRTAFSIIIIYPNRIWHIRTAFIIIITYPNMSFQVRTYRRSMNQNIQTHVGEINNSVTDTCWGNKQLCLSVALQNP